MAPKKAQPGKAVSNKTPMFLVATYQPTDTSGAGTIFIPAPSPNPTALRDLQLQAGLPQVIDPSWKLDPNFNVYVQNGELTLSESARVPSSRQPELDASFELDEKQAQFAINLVKLWPHEQFIQGASIATKHINPATGMPTSKESVVTVTFLKNKHLQTLMAARDLEGRWMKRADLVGFLSKEIDFINNL